MPPSRSLHIRDRPLKPNAAQALALRVAKAEPHRPRLSFCKFVTFPTTRAMKNPHVEPRSQIPAPISGQAPTRERAYSRAFMQLAVGVPRLRRNRVK